MVVSATYGVDVQDLIQYELRDPSQYRKVMRKNTRGARIRASTTTRFNENTPFLKHSLIYDNNSWLVKEYRRKHADWDHITPLRILEGIKKEAILKLEKDNKNKSFNSKEFESLKENTLRAWSNQFIMMWGDSIDLKINWMQDC